MEVASARRILVVKDTVPLGRCARRRNLLALLVSSLLSIWYCYVINITVTFTSLHRSRKLYSQYHMEAPLCRELPSIFCLQEFDVRFMKFRDKESEKTWRREL